jgi:hypothetical protein
LQVRGLITGRWSGLLIFVAAWRQQDRAASDVHGHQESAGIGIRRPRVSPTRCGGTGPGRVRRRVASSRRSRSCG